MEGPVRRLVDRLVPGVSSVTKYARYYALYAAAAAEAERRDLDAQGCRELLRRAEVLLAAVQIAQSPGGIPDGLSPHGHDGVYPGLSAGGGLDLDRTARVYSPRSWGFWSQYGAPAQVLGIVEYGRGGIRPGREQCPAEVGELFAPLLALAGSERTEVRPAELQEAGAAALGEPCAAERDWLASLLTASRDGIHRPDEWRATDRTRRATLRVLAQAVAQHGGDSYTGALRETVAFGPLLADDPVLSTVPEAARWRGLLLRHYSVSAWRRLWADLVTEVGTQDGQDGGQDRSAAELRAWLCDQVPDGTVNEALAALGPVHDRAGHSIPVEPRLLQEEPAPWRDIRVLLAGGLRARDSTDGTHRHPGTLFAGVQRAFLGDRREFLDPMWVEALMREYGDRPVRDLASRLADDMLAQSRRVALRKLRYDPQTGGLKIFSRLHMRNDRYFRIGEESKEEIGIRIPQLGSIGRQLGLFAADAREAGSLTLTEAAWTSLDVVA
ncbi:hypothetical protein [Streptomyces xanthophaeus]|uniref:hypothetical protein n=1 Tax=Streptomyces xanthophaeus TaxID=67385 RepID=UPI0026481FE9|nr:hypothetical protein [Streptomyces xanthophaeus]WKD31349.1 hypothetical protein KO717_04855 [Streptomyces xanthophaeus]